MRDKLGMLYDEGIGDKIIYIGGGSNDKVLGIGSRVLRRWVCGALGKVTTRDRISRTFFALTQDVLASCTLFWQRGDETQSSYNDPRQYNPFDISHHNSLNP
jgi:hypothetical protein